MPLPQPAITLPRTRHAIFQVYGVRSGPAQLERVRRVSGTLDGLVRAVGARAPDAELSCVVAFGSDVWDRLVGPARPRELHPFREVRSGPRFAPSTPGDLFLHIRADDLGLCFELAAQIAAQLGDSVTPIDETHGFRYFDERDLTGFVDGTENPTGTDREAATIVGESDTAFAGGSYIMVQKYLHDLQGWDRLPVETQEGIIGRTKLDDIELDDSVKPSFAHNALTLVEENGEEVDVLRHNMPFGKASGGEAGTYFIAYATSPRPLGVWVTGRRVAGMEGARAERRSNVPRAMWKAGVSPEGRSERLERVGDVDLEAMNGWPGDQEANGARRAAGSGQTRSSLPRL